MGLGKTVVTICFLRYLKEIVGYPGPYLVIAPLSTLPNWRRICEEWSDFNVIEYSGHLHSRKVIKKYEFEVPDVSMISSSNGVPSGTKYLFDVCLVAPDTAVRDSNVLIPIKWSVLVLDEAHMRMKNSNSAFTQTISRYRAAHALLLTGTPVQNNLEELWALLHFIDPDHFVNVDEFITKYDLQNPESLESLHRNELSRYMLRRTKNDVDITLPTQTEMLIHVSMTPKQKEIYKDIFKNNANMLRSRVPALSGLRNLAIRLRQVCCHPYLLPELENQLCLLEEVKTHDEKMKLLMSVSGKMVLLDKLLAKFKKEGNRVLIFSQFVQMLNILDDYLSYRGYTYLRLDGETDTLDRERFIQEFQTKDDVFVFLISTRAGGVGIDLTKADRAIMFDSDWYVDEYA
jgi:chromodomain-helicase-DNA-binding protein 7